MNNERMMPKTNCDKIKERETTTTPAKRCAGIALRSSQEKAATSKASATDKAAKPARRRSASTAIRSIQKPAAAKRRGPKPAPKRHSTNGDGLPQKQASKKAKLATSSLEKKESRPMRKPVASVGGLTERQAAMKAKQAARTAKLAIRDLAVKAYKEEAALIAPNQRSKVPKGKVKEICDMYRVSTTELYNHLRREATMNAKKAQEASGSPEAKNQSTTQHVEHRSDKELEAAKSQASKWAFDELTAKSKDPSNFDPDGSWKAGIVKAVSEEASNRYDLTGDNQLNPHSIGRYFRRGAVPKSSRPGPISPMKELEPELVEFCKAANRVGLLNEQMFLQFAISRLAGSPLEEAVRATKRHSLKEGSPLLGKSYFKNFMKRHKDELEATLPVKLTTKHSLQKETMKQMYDNAYCVLREAGVATFDGENLSSGVLTRPDHLLFVSEMVFYINKTDGSDCEDEDEHLFDASSTTNDSKTTVLGITGANGQPVMCVMIFQGDHIDVPESVRQGFDVRAACENFADLQFTHNGYEQFLPDHVDVEKIHPGGPVCVFRGTTVPCYVTATRHGGLSEPVLTDVLRTIDKTKIFRRSNNIIPVLLLDGQLSCFDVLLDEQAHFFDVEFLSYINDTTHKWFVAGGVPRSSAQAQNTANLPNRNALFESSVRDEMHETLLAKMSLGLGEKLSKQDVIPIVKRAWHFSFSNEVRTRRIIEEQGWGTNLDRRLEKHPMFVVGETEEEHDPNRGREFLDVVRDPSKAGSGTCVSRSKVT